MCLSAYPKYGRSGAHFLLLCDFGEYGFSGSNLESLLTICGFDEVQFVAAGRPRTVKQRVGTLLKLPYLASSRARHRLSGVNHGGQFGSELVVKAVRKDFPPLMNERYR